MILPIVIFNLLVLLFGSIVWKLFYKRHERYHFENRTISLIGRILGHRQLFLLYLLHLLTIMILSSLLFAYVW